MRLAGVVLDLAGIPDLRFSRVSRALEPGPRRAFHGRAVPSLRMETYYHKEHLPRFAEIAEGNKELATAFFAWYNRVFEDGALTAREKALIALAVAHAIQCPYCIDAYTQASLERGSDLEEMTEALHVAAAIRGGASLVHGVQMLDEVKKLSM